MNKKISFPIAIIIIIVICAVLTGVIVWRYRIIPGIAPTPPSSGVLSDKELLKYAKSSFNKEEMMGKNMIIGSYNGNPIRVTFPCSDLCPNYTIRIIRYDVDVSECDKADGLVRAIYVPYAEAMMPEEFCFPKIIVDNNIYEFVEMPEDETADWKTYKNEEYGFEVKYPKDFKCEDYSYKEHEKDIVFRRSCQGLFIEDHQGKTIMVSAVSIYENKETLSLWDWIVRNRFKDTPITVEYLPPAGEEITITPSIGQRITISKIIINNYQGIRIVDLGEGVRSDEVFFVKNGRIYSISRNDAWVKPIYQETFNQILSTFRFLE